MPTLRVATFNIRNINDRYEERRPLLLEAFAAIDPDIIGLQEVTFAEHDQDDMLAQALPARTYRSLRAESPKFRGFGNAILCAVGEVQTDEVLPLGPSRTVQRTMVVLPGQKTVWFVNTHLHHKPLEPEVRTAQVSALLRWMSEAPIADATIITGDFNMPSYEPGYALMEAASFRSSYRMVHGREPAVTWPSGIQATTMDTEGEPNCLDYIWLSGSVTATSARVAANEPAANDPTLYPSDHFALVVEVVVG